MKNPFDLLAAEAEVNAADAAAYVAAKAEIATGRETITPVDIGAMRLRGASLLTTIRKWRGVKQTELAGALIDLTGVGRQPHAHPLSRNNLP